MGFFALYMMVSLASTGAVLFFILEDQVPGTDPLLTLCGFMGYWLAGEIFIRYMMQQLPYMDVRPFLLMPVKKGKLVHYLLLRSGLNFFNFLGLFIFLPFSIVLLVQGYPPLQVLSWLLGVFLLAEVVNYINFLINKSDRIFAVVAVLLLGAFSLQYFGVLNVSEGIGTGIYALYTTPWTLLVPALILVVVYLLNYRYLRDRIFLDASLKRKVKQVSQSDLSWTRKFGSLAPFLQLDLRLIWRNKRTKTQVFISLLMVFYGLIFYSIGDYSNTSAMIMFVGIFMTGIFLMNFGQFIPAWDSSYFSLMMGQNIPLRQYLESKALLISISVVVMFILTIPYVYFGWEALAINFSAALYNLGVNLPVILFFGAFNKKRIDLESSPVGNMQGVSATQFLIMIPLIIIPLLFYFALKFFFSFEVALYVLSAMGILGMAVRNSLMNYITGFYKKKKYGMLAGFSQKDN